MSGNIHLRTSQLFEKYGPLVRIGPSDVITNDPDIYRRMYGARTNYRKSDFYTVMKFDPSRDNILSIRDDNLHSQLRSKVAAGYAGKDIEGLEQQIDQQILAFVNLIERKYISSRTEFRPMDLAVKCHYFALDTISSLAFGSDRIFGYLERDEDVNHFLEMSESNIPVMLSLTVYPAIAKILQMPLFRKLMPSETDRYGFGQFIKVAKQVVAERFGPEPPVRKDIVNSFLAHGLTREELESEILVTIVAGSDTTATSLRCTMFYLMTSPGCYTTLKREIQGGIEEGRISSPVTDSEARDLQFLQAVIKEGLRMYPPIVHLQTMEVPHGGDTILGKYLPNGTKISNGLWSTVHDKVVFGDDADCFRPERWLEADEQHLRKMNMACDGIFKAGKWSCLGKPLALMKLNKAFVELLRRFDFTLTKPTSPFKSYNAGIFIQSDMWVKVTRSLA